MVKNKQNFVCTNCGAKHHKWSGKCDNCNSWGTITEADGESGFSKIKAFGKSLELKSLDGEISHSPRKNVGIAELDRVLGGGLIKGSAILIGGEPGIGKSTILLQLAHNIAKNDKAIYVTGEESVDQVKLRAKRIGIDNSRTSLISATNVGDIISTLEKNKPAVVIIDSVQTMFLDTVESAPGTVSQVRSASFELINVCKRIGCALFLVGHVTKEGQIAGPKVLEHMVDTVLYFEGDRGLNYRILRSVKNRFGAAGEIGVFEMSDKGLVEVNNPSKLFISNTAGQTAGSVVFPGLEGSRIIISEIQALVAPSYMANPRRAVVGWDSSRLAMILAVLYNTCNIQLADKEVYLNVAGGFKINEPAADLAVAAALISAVSKVPIKQKSVIFGEIGLSGEVRNVSKTDSRIKEAKKLGFEGVILPQIIEKSSIKEISFEEIKNLKELKSLLF